jgi:hypothetical protein
LRKPSAIAAQARLNPASPAMPRQARAIPTGSSRESRSREVIHVLDLVGNRISGNFSDGHAGEAGDEVQCELVVRFVTATQTGILVDQRVDEHAAGFAIPATADEVAELVRRHVREEGKVDAESRDLLASGAALGDATDEASRFVAEFAQHVPNAIDQRILTDWRRHAAFLS